MHTVIAVFVKTGTRTVLRNKKFHNELVRSKYSL